MKAKIISSTLLCKAFGTLTEYEFEFPRFDGTIGRMSREIYDRGHAAAVLPYNPATKHVLLIRQFRPPAMVNGHAPFLLEAVGGRLEGDSPETCVRREAIEEAGVDINQLEFVSAAYGLCAFSTELLSMYLGTYDAWNPEIGGGLAHEGEDIQTIEIPFDDAFAMISSGAIVDMKTILLLQALKIKGGLTPKNQLELTTPA